MAGAGDSGVGSGSGMSEKEKARMSRTSLIFWHTHQNSIDAVRHLLDEDPTLVEARDYDNRTPLHVAAIHGLTDVARCLLEHKAEVNAEDRWKNSPLDDALGAKMEETAELLIKYGGKQTGGHNGSHFEPKAIPPPLPSKCDWEIDPNELDLTNSTMVGKGSFGEILKVYWRGTPVALKRILPSLSDDRLVTQDFRHEVNILVKLRHPNIVQFLGAVTESKPLMLITEFLRGGDLHQYMKEKKISPLTAVNFALDIARGMAYLHNEPNVVIHRDLKPRNVLLVNSNADHLKVGDFGLSKIIKVQHSNDTYKLTGETGSYRYMAPEVFRHKKYDMKVDIFSFGMILYEMLEGEAPFFHLEPYEAAKRVSEGNRPTIHVKGYPPELKDLTEQCWAQDMAKRPSFLEILKILESIKESWPSHATHGKVLPHP